MRDILSDFDVRLIEAHIARKGVTVVAPGVYGIDPYAPYTSAYTKMHAARAEKVTKRREKVLGFVEEGLTVVVIAKKLKTTELTIDHDIRALKDQGRILDENRSAGARHG